MYTEEAGASYMHEASAQNCAKHTHTHTQSPQMSNYTGSLWERNKDHLSNQGTGIRGQILVLWSLKPLELK